MLSPSDVAGAVAYFSAAYGERFVVNRVTSEVWFDVLADLEPDELTAAVRTWTRVSKFPPTPSEIRGLVPRLCRCLKCSACRRRAEERARVALRNGAVGYDPERSDASRLSITDDTARVMRELAERRAAATRQVAENRTRELDAGGQQ